MNKLISTAVAGTLAAATMTALGSTQAADAGTTSVSSQQRAAVVHIMSGKYTQADINLVKSNPALAAQVPDPTSRGTTVTNSYEGSRADAFKGEATAKQKAAAESLTCDHRFSHTETKHSFTGEVMYRYKHSVGWCDEGIVLKKWLFRSDFVSATDDHVDFSENRWTDTAHRIDAYKAYSRMGRKVQVCVPMADYCSFGYPYASIIVNTRGPERGAGRDD